MNTNNLYENARRRRNALYILAFDEYGNFENVEDAQTKYVAGLLYSGTARDIGIERNRILTYLSECCTEADASFPEDLHQNGARNNWSKVTAVEKAVKRTLAEFMQKGTYRGAALQDDSGNDYPDRQGTYDIFAIVKSNAGKPELLAYEADAIVNDKIGSNLYVHMAEDILCTLLFHNPIYGELKDVRLELATRTLPGGVISPEKRREFREIGIYDESGFRAANMDTYRTMLQREMLRLGKVDQDISLHTMAIRYQNADPSMAFLYMSDLICGYLHNEPKSTDAAKIKYAHKKALEFSGRTPLVFGYDVVDVQYAKAWQYMEEDRFYEALETGYDACCGQSTYASFYKEHWLPRIEQAIAGKKDSYALRVAVKKLESATLSSFIDTDKLLFIYETLERCCVDAHKERRDSRMMYKLYNSGIAAYNHVGDPAGAKKCFDECLKYVEAVSTDEFIRTRNRLAVACCDSFDFIRAEELTRDTIAYAELVRENRALIFGDAGKNDILYGITQSQYGQILAYMRDSRSEEHFREALHEMRDSSANAAITASYLLHHYLDMGEKEMYEAEAAAYFGGYRDLPDQYDYMCTRESGINPKYGLYILVKAAWIFYADEIPKGFQDVLSDIKTSFTGKEIGFLLDSEHPWELIYKYLLFFAVKNKDRDAERRYQKLLAKPMSVSEGASVEAVRKYGEICYYSMKNNNGAKIQRLRALYDEMAAHGFIEGNPNADDREKERLLEETFRYMNL